MGKRGKRILIGVGLLFIAFFFYALSQSNVDETYYDDEPVVVEEESTEAESDEEEATDEATTDSEDEEDLMSLDEYIDNCKSLDTMKFQRNPEKYYGKFFYVDVFLWQANNKYIVGQPIYWDKEEKEYAMDESFMKIEITDNRSKDLDNYFRFVESDNVRIYGRYDGMIEYDNGNISYDFNVEYAELLDNQDEPIYKVN